MKRGGPHRNDCCGVGTYSCQLLSHAAGRVFGVDACIADLVSALNAAGIPTVASCCGHGGNGSVALADGRELIIKWPKEKP